MFKVNEWVKGNLIRGYEKGVFAGEYAAVLAAGFFAKGVLSHDDVEEIALATQENQTVPEEIE